MVARFNFVNVHPATATPRSAHTASPLLAARETSLTFDSSLDPAFGSMQSTTQSTVWPAEFQSGTSHSQHDWPGTSKGLPSEQASAHVERHIDVLPYFFLELW
jgi:hypothetical protein